MIWWWKASWNCLGFFLRECGRVALYTIGSTPGPQDVNHHQEYLHFLGSGILKKLHLWLASWVKGNPKWAGYVREGLVNPALKIPTLLSKLAASLWEVLHVDLKFNFLGQFLSMRTYNLSFLVVISHGFVSEGGPKKPAINWGERGAPISRIQRNPMQTHEFWEPFIGAPCHSTFFPGSGAHPFVRLGHQKFLPTTLVEVFPNLISSEMHG